MLATVASKHMLLLGLNLMVAPCLWAGVQPVRQVDSKNTAPQHIAHNITAADTFIILRLKLVIVHTSDHCGACHCP